MELPSIDKPQAKLTAFERIYCGTSPISVPNFPRVANDGSA